MVHKFILAPLYVVCQFADQTLGNEGRFFTHCQGRLFWYNQKHVSQINCRNEYKRNDRSSKPAIHKINCNGDIVAQIRSTRNLEGRVGNW